MSQGEEMDNFKKIRVAIIGGGVAGMTAAHELMDKTYVTDKNKKEYLFDIHVFEKDEKYCGGKARSVRHMENNVLFENSNTKYKWLPAEHGFRFFPGFYVNIDQSFARIKSGKNSNVLKNLKHIKYYSFFFDKEIEVNKKEKQPLSRPGTFPTHISHKFFKSIKEAFRLVREINKVHTVITPEGRNKVASVIVNVLTACKQRMDFEYDKISWADFVEANKDYSEERFGKDYRLLFSDGISRNLVAARADKVSTRTGSLILKKMLEYILSTGSEADRVLNGPTNETWLNLWKDEMTDSSHPNPVKYHHGYSIRNIVNDKNKIVGVEFDDYIEEGVSTDSSFSSDLREFDYFLFAVPAEVISTLLKRNRINTSKIVHKRSGQALKSLTYYDPNLRNVEALGDHTEWMVGIIFYLKQPLNIEASHINFIDAEWAITAIYQSHKDIWDGEHFSADSFGDGKIEGIFSLDISNWETPVKKISGLAKDDPEQSKFHSLRACELKRSDVIEAIMQQISKSPFILNEDNTTYSTFDIDYIIKEYTYLDEAIVEKSEVCLLEEYNGFFERYNLAPSKKYIDNDPLEGVVEKPRIKESFREGELAAAYQQYIEIRQGDFYTEDLDIVRYTENETPLLVNEVNTYSLRPMSYTAIPNLFLAGDYVATDVDLATMEGANESAKKAVNAIIKQQSKDYVDDKGNPRFKKVKHSEVLLYKNPLGGIFKHMFASFGLLFLFVCLTAPLYATLQNFMAPVANMVLERIWSILHLNSVKPVFINIGILVLEVLCAISFVIYSSVKKRPTLVTGFFIFGASLIISAQLLLRVVNWGSNLEFIGLIIVAILTIIGFVPFALVLLDLMVLGITYVFLVKKDHKNFLLGKSWSMPNNVVVRFHIWLVKQLTKFLTRREKRKKKA